MNFTSVSLAALKTRRAGAGLLGRPSALWLPSSITNAEIALQKAIRFELTSRKGPQTAAVIQK